MEIKKKIEDGVVIDKIYDLYGHEFSIRNPLNIEGVITESDRTYIKRTTEIHKAAYLNINIMYRMRKILKDHCE